MGLDDIKRKAQELAGQHGDKIGQGLDKAGTFAKNRFGHDSKVDQALDKAKGFLGDQNAKDDQNKPGEEPPGDQPRNGPEQGGPNRS